MRSRWIWAGFVLAAAAQAAEVEEITLQQALARASKRPIVQAAKLRADAAREGAPAQGVLPDPVLSIGAFNAPLAGGIGQEPMAAWRLSLQQRIPYPGKLAASERASTALARAAEAEARAQTLAVLTQTVKAWAKAASLARALAIVEESLRELEQAAEAARARYRTGKGLQQDVWLAELERSRMEKRRVKLQAELAAAESELAAWVGAPDGRVRAKPDRIVPARAPDADALIAAMRTHAPVLAALKARAEAAKAMAERAELDELPDFTVGAAYARRIGALPRRDLASAWLGITLPLYADRKQKRIAAQKSAEAEAALQRLADEEIALAGRLRAWCARIQGMLKEIEWLEKRLIPEAEQTVASMRIGYAVGKVDFLNYARAIVARNELRIRRVMLAAEALALFADARATAGLEPVPETPRNLDASNGGKQ